MKKKDKEKPKDEQSAVRQSEFEELRNNIESLQKEKDEIFEKLQRVSADYANYQKRVPRQISDSINYEKEKIIKSLLPALDNFEHTLQNSNSAENIDILTKGIRIIYDQMLDILKSHGVEQMKTLGQTFDPAQHEAMMRKNEPDKDDNTIVEEFQKGYKLNDRVIRPSKVVVNKLETGQAIPQQEISEKDKAVEDFETTDTEQ
jgi:molecular chaperone GrpE